MRFLSLVALLVCGFAVVSCGSSAPDYTKAPAQTGGPEQGEWRNQAGTMLALNSGKFTYRKADGSSVEGTYKVQSGSILLSGSGGQTMTAGFPSQTGPVVLDGANLVKTD